MVGMVLMGPKFCTQVPSKIQDKKLPCLSNLTVKAFSFSTKKIDFVFITGVVLSPQDPQDLEGVVPVGAKFGPQVPSMPQVKNPTCL